MPDVVGIRFKSCGKIYDFEVNGVEVSKGDLVVVESELGLSMGNVVVEKHSLDTAAKELKKVLRKATEDDLRQKSENKALEEEAMAYCIERIMARGLPMKMICTEVTLDKKRLIFYFTADGRIDFRELVKDLAAKFKTRIEMRQVGVRDASKIVGGIGICGRELCCKTFLTSFEPISIRMAKRQELVLNANKLSGVCGRLMCCLGYEYGESEKGEGGKRTEDETARLEEGTEEGQMALIEEAPAPPARKEPVVPISERSRKETGRQKPHFRSGDGREIRGHSARQAPKETHRAGAADRTAQEELRSEEVRPETSEVQSGEKAQEGKFHRRKRRRRKFRK
ncbi:MAG TPA: stage 0 sporulation family protein [Thermodesulfovibrionales bacterium]|nr:stage 0 sporulation family protein [Thermodesulfovibrionales bacterium]